MNSLEDQLAAKRREMDQVRQKSKQEFSVEDVKALQTELLRLERLVGEKCGEPYATEWCLPDVWHGMTLDGVVIGGQINCALVFEGKLKSGCYSVLEFRHVAGYKLVDVSDETITAHPLTGRGLAAYGTFIVHNSPWILELEKIDQCHDQFNPERWRHLRHYMVCFKDSIFEAVAVEAAVMATSRSRQDAIGCAIGQLASK